MRVRFRDFSKGWWPMGPPEGMPAGTLRRAEGVNSIRTGVLRSRWGSTGLYSLASHSLFRFRDVRFQGAGTGLYRDGTLIRGSLSGDRLTFVSMPPQPGDEDYLFVAGGGTLFKVDNGGSVTQWGIAAPTFSPTVAAGGGGTPNGVYGVAVTFLNSITGSRSNPDPAALAGTPTQVTVANQKIEWSNIPISNDPQVDTRELWRTSANLGVLFKLTEIADNTTTTYSDDNPDTALQDEILPLDNLVPQADYNDALGPYVGRMWWANATSAGNQGRIFYSPVGRPESVVGFIEINNGNDPVVRLVFWGGSLYGFTNGKVIQVIGTDEPFTWREVFGAPGTTDPFTVTPTPFGIFYHSFDGVRVFNGTDSTLVGYDAIAELLTGESMEGIPPFEPDIGVYTGREVWMADGTTTLMLDLRSSAWRYVQLGLTAMYFEPDTQTLIVADADGTGIPEVVGETLDGGTTAIPFEIETPGSMIDVKTKGLVVRAYFDINTRGNLMTPTLVIDNDEVLLPPFKTSDRSTVEIQVGRWGLVFSLRLEGTLTDIVDVFGIESDVYVPQGQTT